ncbi:unnamed protein product [Allacma fusca]|uniref:Uncharacterized protein n=1 Tax=Allacma fusca TaxID=39272 RepID=A0A8J2Q4E0_9HEXA|nr:unnamed protein product [Allacma fusca]
MSIAYIICYCCRKKRKESGGDEESLQGILADGNSSNKDTTSVKSHNGVLNIKAPLMKTKSIGAEQRNTKKKDPKGSRRLWRREIVFVLSLLCEKSVRNKSLVEGMENEAGLVHFEHHTRADGSMRTPKKSYCLTSDGDE